MQCKRRCGPLKKEMLVTEKNSFGAICEQQKRVLPLKLPRIDCDRLPDSLISMRLRACNHSLRQLQRSLKTHHAQPLEGDSWFIFNTKSVLASQTSQNIQLRVGIVSINNAQLRPRFQSPYAMMFSRLIVICSHHQECPRTGSASDNTDVTSSLAFLIKNLFVSTWHFKWLARNAQRLSQLYCKLLKHKDVEFYHSGCCNNDHALVTMNCDCWRPESALGLIPTRFLPQWMNLK